MPICFLVDTSGLPIEAANSKSERRENELMDALLQKRLDRLQNKGVISGYTTIEGTYLGFPISKPANTMIYRVDNVVRDLDKVVQEYKSGEAQLESELKKVRGWQNAEITSPQEVKGVKKARKLFYDQAHAFFGTDDISRWTAEIDALDGADPSFKENDKRGCKNKLSKEAFLALIYGSGYVMARVVVVDGKLLQFEQGLDGKYIRRTINV